MIPGWVDLQVNGFRGVDFSSPDLTLQGIDLMSTQLLQEGVVGYCPTLISSPLEVYRHNLPLIAEASKSENGAQVLGVHLEGPLISPDDGARGIYPQDCITLPSIELFEKFRSWSQEKIALLTLAPEQKGAMKLIKHIVNTSKIVVSIGHHKATNEIIKEAVDAGVRAATHIGNGLPEMIHRHDNPVWPTLAEDRLTGMFVTDGFHLPKEMVKVCLRAKGTSRFIVTSDLVHIAGYRPGNYDFHGIPVTLEANGRLHRKGPLQLAGSSSAMMECMSFLTSIGETDWKDLTKIGFENPLKLLDSRIEEARLSQAPSITCDGRRLILSKEALRK
nr:N-acetylglucosamine-6-phosphate deacetylase [Candidatus Njordarchaeota archaeon]